MILLIGFLSFGASNAVPAGVEELREALEYQYQQRQAHLETEIAQLKQQLQSASQELQSCRYTKAERTPAPTSPKKKESNGADTQLFMTAMNALQLKNYNEALLSFEQVVQSNPESDLADNAILMMAEIYVFRGESQLALAELERLLQLYPTSERAPQAQKQMRSIQEKMNSKPISQDDLNRETPSP